MVNRVMYDPQLLVLRIKLKELKPDIVREVLVRNTITFEKLHTIIQTAMGWQNVHLYEFDKGNQRVVTNISEEAPSPRYKLYSVRSTPVAMLLNEPKNKTLYMYDFGDDWAHELTVTKVLPDDPAVVHPVCLKAARACPPEDCGGPFAFQDILEMLKSDDPGEEFEEILDWLGDDYDPKFVDLEAINKRLKRIKM
jgi:hypothetical protein